MATPDHDNIVGRGGATLPIHAIAAADTTDPPTQTTALANAPLGYGFNAVAASGSDDDAVALPPAKPGAVVILQNNDAAQDIEVWPNTGDTIDSGTVNAKDAAALGQNAFRIYIANSATNWVTLTALS